MGNKDKENEGMKERTHQVREEFVKRQDEYNRLRQDNDDVVSRNKALKDEIVGLQDRVQREKDEGVEIRAHKDKVAHSLYRAGEDMERCMFKEEELKRRLQEKQWEQQDKEDRLKELDRMEREKEPRLGRVKAEMQDLNYVNIQMGNDIG